MRLLRIKIRRVVMTRGDDQGVDQPAGDDVDLPKPISHLGQRGCLKRRSCSCVPLARIDEGWREECSIAAERYVQRNGMRCESWNAR